MAWTPTLLRVVAGDHATRDCKSLRWNPVSWVREARLLFGYSNEICLHDSAEDLAGIFRPQKISLHAPGDSVER